MKATAARGSGLIFFVGFATLFIACTTEPTEEAIMQANGSFDVKVTPQQSDNPDATAANVSRLSLSKQYHGVLAAASHGEMPALGDGTKSGAYVALEKVSGSLDGRPRHDDKRHHAQRLGQRRFDGAGKRGRRSFMA
jgi:hypothetical protein